MSSCTFKEDEEHFYGCFGECRSCAKFRSNNNPEKQPVTQTLFRVQSRYGIFVASRHCRYCGRFPYDKNQILGGFSSVFTPQGSGDKENNKGKLYLHTLQKTKLQNHLVNIYSREMKFSLANVTANWPNRSPNGRLYIIHMNYIIAAIKYAWICHMARHVGRVYVGSTPSSV